jgi:histidyl-tRNA synthetase
MDDETRSKAFSLACSLREQGISAEVDHMARSVKAQLKYADKLGVPYVAVIGSDELNSGVVNVKRMSDGTQEAVKMDELYTYLNK